MIRLSRLNGKEFVVNCELIKFIEETPDTVITLATGEKLMVREKADDVIRLATEYRKKIFQEPIGDLRRT
ncbi:MAG: flagellar FlbD family protein [Bdellovibrionota bacterium]